jgi:RNA polymerase sigma factor (sigma-70 family)
MTKPPTKPGGTAATAPELSLRPDRLDELFRTESPRLTTYFRRRVGDLDEAVDLMQEAFARLAGARPETSLRSPERYLQRIARNLLFNRSRARSAKAVEVVPFYEESSPVVTFPAQEDQIAADDLFAQYVDAVKTLSPKTREVFLLHRVDELSYKEIAVRLDVTIGTVEYHITRALAQLGRALASS